MSVERPEVEVIVLPRRPDDRIRRRLVRAPDGWVCEPGEPVEVTETWKRRTDVAGDDDLDAQCHHPRVLPDLRTRARERPESSK